MCLELGGSKKMKKLVLLLITLMLVLTGCSNGGNDDNEAGDYKAGSYSITKLALTDADAENDGRVQFNTTIVSVLLDGDTIKDVQIDVAQNNVPFTVDGQVTVPTDTPTKLEKGDAYGMKETSANIGEIEGGAEWFEQIASLEEWMIGKTVEEVLAMDTYEKDASHTAVPNVDELKTSVTIHVGDYLNTLEKAVETATAVEGTPAKLGSGSVTSISANEEGRIQANTAYAHVVLDADGKILNSFIDVAQNNAVVAEDGTIEGTAKDSKYILKDAYGMKETSAKIGNIDGGGEWFEQADAFVAHVKGLTVEEVVGLELTDGVPSSEDLTSSVTVTVGDWLAAYEKAGKNAR